MKRRFFLLISILILSILGCSKHNSYFNIENADNITILYGASNYTLHSTDKEIVKIISENLNSLSFKATDKQMDPFSMFSITLNKDTSLLAFVHVDSQGVFWIDDSSNCYEVKSGKFDYSYIKNIYDDKN